MELRIVAAIRNKLLLITRKHPRLDCLSCVSTSIGASDSPVEEFQYIRVGQDENVYVNEWRGVFGVMGGGGD